ncbi:hypothetical protein PTKIN_Ptkin12aG0011100 [Pterospermum kingtungense]
MMKKAELVFVPWPGMGHLVSAVELAKLLVSLNSHISITLLIIKSPYDPKVDPYVDSLTANTTTTSRIKFIILPKPEAANDASGADLFSKLIETRRPLMKEAVTNIVQLSNSVPDSPRLAGFVLDMFFTPLTDLADEFGVPNYVFYTPSAAFLGFQLYVQALHDEQNVNISEFKDSDTEFTIPSFVNPVSAKFLPSGILKPEGSTLLNDITRRFRKAKGIMINTFSELESHAVNSLVSDGRGLPEGFLDRTNKIGKIIGWAPQIAILDHSAIGGVVSHSGWNSTLESVWFGVPIATWPLYAEQQLNAFQLVMDLELAVEVKMNYRKEKLGNDEVEIVRAENIERGIRRLMEKDSNIRKRVKEMSEKSRKALMKCGSSHSTLYRFINDVMDNLS